MFRGSYLFVYTAKKLISGFKQVLRHCHHQTQLDSWHFSVSLQKIHETLTVIAAFKERWLQIPTVGFQRALIASPSPTMLRMRRWRQPGWATARCDVRLETKDSDCNKWVVLLFCFSTYQTHDATSVVIACKLSKLNFDWLQLLQMIWWAVDEFLIKCYNI